jgi:hypothetical protein
MWKRWMEKLERIWIAVTFAEHGEVDTALEWLPDPDAPWPAPEVTEEPPMPRPPAAAH